MSKILNSSMVLEYYAEQIVGGDEKIKDEFHRHINTMSVSGLENFREHTKFTEVKELIEALLAHHGRIAQLKKKLDREKASFFTL